MVPRGGGGRSLPAPALALLSSRFHVLGGQPLQREEPLRLQILSLEAGPRASRPQPCRHPAPCAPPPRCLLPPCTSPPHPGPPLAPSPLAVTVARDPAINAHEAHPGATSSSGCTPAPLSAVPRPRQGAGLPLGGGSAPSPLVLPPLCGVTPGQRRGAPVGGGCTLGRGRRDDHC